MLQIKHYQYYQSSDIINLRYYYYYFLCTQEGTIRNNLLSPFRVSIRRSIFSFLVRITFIEQVICYPGNGLDIPSPCIVTLLIDMGLVPARRCWVKYLSLIHSVLSSINASCLDGNLTYSWEDNYNNSSDDDDDDDDDKILINVSKVSFFLIKYQYKRLL